MKLRLPFGRQHRPRVDALGPSPERAAFAAEDGAERALGNGGNLTDEIELVILQPSAYAGVELRHYLQRMGRQKAPLVSRLDV